ncbi:unnamed protein product [Ectocarpus sp. CCAP 1310/34]|nr:unnamed protein product [Ectocarpus sp. CCAP 1310/34]
MQQLLRALAAASALFASGSARASPGTAGAAAVGAGGSRKNAWTQRREPKVELDDARPPPPPLPRSAVSRATSGLSSCLGLRGGGNDKGKADAIDGPCIGIDLGTTYRCAFLSSPAVV